MKVHELTLVNAVIIINQQEINMSMYPLQMVFKFINGVHISLGTCITFFIR
jgi:hypothetical protein